MTIYRYMNFAILGADGKPIQNTNPADNAVAQTYKNIMSEIGGIKNSVSQLANVVSHGMGMGNSMLYNGNQNMFQNMMGQFLQGAMGGNAAGGPDQRGHTILGGLAGVLGRGIMNTRNKIYDKIVGGFDRAVNGDKAKTYEYGPEQRPQETQGNTDNPAENNTQNDQQQNNTQTNQQNNNQNNTNNQNPQDEALKAQQQQQDELKILNDKKNGYNSDLTSINQELSELQKKLGETPPGDLDSRRKIQEAISKKNNQADEIRTHLREVSTKLQELWQSGETNNYSHIRSYSDLMLFCRKCKEEYRNDPRRKR